MKDLDKYTVAPPHNISAEEAVLGAVLLSNAALPWLVEHLPTYAFYRERHRIIYDAMKALHEQGRVVDPLTVTERLRLTRQLDEVGGKAGVDVLTGAVPNLAGVKDYAEIVLSSWRWRMRLSIAYEQISAVMAFDEAGWARAVARTQDPRLQVTEAPQTPTLRRVA